MLIGGKRRSFEVIGGRGVRGALKSTVAFLVRDNDLIFVFLSGSVPKPTVSIGADISGIPVFESNSIHALHTHLNIGQRRV